MGWCHTCRLIHYSGAKKAATDPYTIDWSGVTPSFNASQIRAVTSSRMRLAGEQLQMRYYKAISISSLDADVILQGDWVSLNPHAVIYFFDRWFDIRQMTSSEVASFTNDCMRTVVAEIRAGTVRPH